MHWRCTTHSSGQPVLSQGRRIACLSLVPRCDTPHGPPYLLCCPQMTTVHVNLAARSYDIIITHGELNSLGSFARQRWEGSLAFIVGDENVRNHVAIVEHSLADVGYKTSTVLLPAGEATKSLRQAEQLYDHLAELRADRKTLVIPVGGGVVGDLAGFVAATFARGLPLLMVPTTLLAMVDSSVGGKVGINHPRAKNLIGAFHQPVGVWIDLGTLATLPEREYRSGLAEIVKYGVILDAEFFAYLETHAGPLLLRQPEVLLYVVARCCRLKADVVEQDEREETGLRAVLNYGHTFAHAFEAVAGYGTWLHGEAVAAGMICASRLAEWRQLIPPEVTARQVRLLKQFGLPTAPDRWPAADVVAAMASDKKSLGGRLRFVLPRRLGEVDLVDGVSADEVLQVLQQAMSSYDQ